MGASRHDYLEPFFFYDLDGAGANPIARYSIVSLATAAEIATISGAGALPANVGYGDVCVRTPLAGGLPTRPVLGVTDSSMWSLGLPSADVVPVHVDGIVLVQFNAAVAADPGQLITAVAGSTRATNQTPFINNYDMLIPFDPRVSITYELSLAGALTIAPQSNLANVRYFPLGYMLDTPTAQYDILRVDMTRCPKEIWA